MSEEWQDVPGYGGLYQVSNLGRVKRAARQVVQIVEYPEQLLTGEIDRDGYHKVAFSVANPQQYGLDLENTCSNGKKGQRHFSKHLVHRLVVEAFDGPISDGMHVNHKDCDRTNNCPENLEVVTPQENVAYSFKHGLRERTCPTRKYSSKIVTKILKLRANGLTYKQISEQLNVPPSSVAAWCTRYKERHIA
jgi:hypothetical protein